MAQKKTSGGTALAYVGGAAVAIVIVVGGIYLSGPAPVSDDVPANLPEGSELPPTADVTEASPEVSAPAGTSPEPEAVPDAQQPTEPSAPLMTEAPEQVETPAEPVAEAAPEADDDGPASLTAPTFDIVRVDPTGEALVAGKALPGAEVDVLVDNAVVDTVTASDGDGGFVSFLTLSPTGQAQVLTLVMRVGDQSVASEDQVILAPLVAQAETPPTETPPTETPATETPQTEALTELAQADPVAEEAPDLPPVEAQDQPADTETQVAELTEALTARDEESAAPQGASAPAASSDEPETTVQAATADPAPTDPAPEEDAPAPVELVEAQPEVAQSVTETPEPAPEPEVAPADASAEEQIAEVVATPDPAVEPAPSEPEATEASAPEAETPEAVSVETAASDEPAEPEVSEPQPDTSGAGLAVLKAGPDGLEILRPAGPADAVVKLALDAIGYSATGDVQLAGRAGAGHRVRIYLNNHLTDVTEADETGRWAANLQDIVPGVYRLRLDEIDSGDDVLNRVETPFKREAPEVLQPLVAAQDGDAAQPPVRAVTVQEGDTLWAISRERYGDGFLYVKVFEANRSDILDPDLIYPGQVFALPD